jgi:hypothetical protein
MSLPIRRALAAITTALAVGAPLPARAQIVSTGGPVYVQFAGSVDTPLRSELWFFGSVNPGPDQTPFDTYSAIFLFANQGAQTSAAPGSGGVGALNSPTANLNPGGMFAAGAQLFFGLFVQDLYLSGAQNPNAPGSRGAWFYTGTGAFNFDGRIHAVVNQTSPGNYTVGFEDLCRTGTQASTDPLCYNTVETADFDFDDHVFTVSNTLAPTATIPEPGTWALLGTGLLAIGGVSLRRRRAA